jgi:TPP-dependent indolepyruvate ferredoxin oxidoreductase alpha subunit
VDPHPRQVAAIADVLRREVAHRGLSVVIAARECKEIVRRRARSAPAGMERAEPAPAAAAETPRHPVFVDEWSLPADAVETGVGT